MNARGGVNVPLGELRDRMRATLNRGVGALLPWIMIGSLRRRFRGVWRLGPHADLPPGGVLLAPNHHSWWDAYLVWLAVQRLGREALALMDERQLDRFPFFRRVGAISDTELRTALRGLDEGKVLIVFPEGELRPPGVVGPLRPGAAFLARRAGVPLVPLAIRVALRGAPWPEAYLSIGDPLPPGTTGDALRRRLDELLGKVDTALREAHPEDVPHDAVLWLGGRGGTRERRAWWERLWRS